GTGELDPKSIRRIEKSPDYLAALMPDMNIAHHCVLAIPGKFGIRAQKWNSLESEPIQHGVADGLPARLAFAQFRRSRNFEARWGQKSYIGHEAREPDAFEQSAQI